MNQEVVDRDVAVLGLSERRQLIAQRVLGYKLWSQHRTSSQPSCRCANYPYSQMQRLLVQGMIGFAQSFRHLVDRGHAILKHPDPVGSWRKRILAEHLE